jgi:RHS repeat-associated protein
VWFDDLKIEITDKPTAMVVQENHYYPFGLGMKGLDYTAPSPNRENKFTFNGKEKETKLSLHMYEFGARNYDPQILRFTSVDRFAEKYYNFSSYQYAANNPIRYIDVNGDSISVSYGGQSYLYQNGQLYSRQADGSRKLHLTQTGSFLSKTLTALNLIGSGGKAGQELIKYFENGSLGKDIRIQSGTNNERSGLISFNPDEELKSISNQDGSKGRPSYIGLAHEIGHTWDRYENGRTNIDSDWYVIDANNTASNSEKIATWWENRVRSENGVALREFYSFNTDARGKVIGDPRGRLLLKGSRTSMWNFNRVSIQSNPIQINQQIKIPAYQIATTNLPFSY